MEDIFKKIEQEIDEFLKKTSLKKEQQKKRIVLLKAQITTKFDEKLSSFQNKIDIFKELIERKKELSSHKFSIFKKVYLAKFFLNIRHFSSAPFIYIMVFPALLLHLFLEIYHQICFRLYKIPRVKHRDYFVFDRYMLPYLNWLEKINCLYCSYFNALISYAREIAGRTEKYWCPIKHAERMKDVHNHYDSFVEYLDGKELRENWNMIRDFHSLKKDKMLRWEKRE